MKYCEFCGSMGGYYKTYVEGQEYSGNFDLCEKCIDGWEFYNIEGKTREKVLEFMNHTELSEENGPKSGYLEKDQSDNGTLNVCNICHKKSEVGLYLSTDGSMDGTIPPELKKFIPRYFHKNLYTCHICLEKISVKFVETIEDTNLALYINYNGAGDCSTINDGIQDLVKKRLAGELLVELPSFEDMKRNKFTIHDPAQTLLNVSTDYICKKDFYLLMLDRKDPDKDGYAEVNPFIVAKYEHGFYLPIPNTYTHDKKEYGYSDLLITIFQGAIDSRYDGIHFNSSGLHFKELEGIKLKP